MAIKNALGSLEERNAIYINDSTFSSNDQENINIRSSISSLLNGSRSSKRESSHLDDLNEEAISMQFMNTITSLSTMLGIICVYHNLAYYEGNERSSSPYFPPSLLKRIQPGFISVEAGEVQRTKTRPNEGLGDREDNDDKKVVAEIMARCFFPALLTTIPWEGFHFVGHEIRITEAMDCYGAVVWPSALVLCYFLETNVKQYNMVDKNVIEIGAGTGLISIVASLLGAYVTATDLPELLGNLQYNISRNTKMKCKHLPQVKELSWGIALDKNFPRSSNNFDYILAADVVYAHPFLEELLITFDHLCKEATIILWVMKFRLEKENKFIDRFKELFDVEEISSFPSLNIKLYKAMKKNRRSA